MTWAYSPSYGKPLSVPQGIIGLMTRFGMDVTLAHPEGYDLIPDGGGGGQARTPRPAAASSGRWPRMDEAFKGADIVYPKSWAPYKVMQQRTELLRAGDHDGLKALEKDCLAQNAQAQGLGVRRGDDEAHAKGGEALYMHCLPADITGVSCERGEVSAERLRASTASRPTRKPATSPTSSPR